MKVKLFIEAALSLPVLKKEKKRIRYYIFC